jgi:hypothetical protein
LASLASLAFLASWHVVGFLASVVLAFLASSLHWLHWLFRCSPYQTINVSSMYCIGLVYHSICLSIYGCISAY